MRLAFLGQYDMSILQIGGAARDTSSKKLEKLLASLERDRAREVSDKVQEGGRTIGERHETITGALEEAHAALSCIQGVQTALDRARKTLSEEFETRRADRAEIVALNALLEQTGQDLSASWTRENDLQARLSTTEQALGETRSIRVEMEALANARLADVTRLTGEVSSLRAEGAEQRNAIEQMTAKAQRLEEDNARLRAKVEELETRRQEAESQAAMSLQARSLTQAELGVLERRVESLTGEVARGARTVADLEAQLMAEKARGRQLEGAAQNAQGEVDRLNRAAEEMAEKAKAQVETAELRLETAQARATRLEEENADLTKRLTEATARDRAFERDTGEMKLRLERSEEQLTRLTADLAQVRKEHSGVEAARATAVERADRMSELAESRHTENKRLDEQVEALQGRVAALESDLIRERQAADERVKALTASIERERSERSIVMGELDAARKGRARLHLEILKANRGRPVELEAMSDETPRAANTDA